MSRLDEIRARLDKATPRLGCVGQRKGEVHMTPEENEALYKQKTGVSSVHTLEGCYGPCIVHWPIRPLAGRELVYRYDIGVTEEICAHGIGHTVYEDLSRGSDIVHSCDGCCADWNTKSRIIVEQIDWCIYDGLTWEEAYDG